MGTGKSSLVKWLCQQFELVPFFEPHDENPYLADFYGDMKRWAFSSQLFFLMRRFRIHRLLCFTDADHRDGPARLCHPSLRPPSAHRRDSTAPDVERPARGAKQSGRRSTSATSESRSPIRTKACLARSRLIKSGQ